MLTVLTVMMVQMQNYGCGVIIPIVIIINSFNSRGAPSSPQMDLKDTHEDKSATNDDKSLKSREVEIS